ncbi:MAG TPA: TetR/AcrR family transcriptional regulator [Acidimicrobiales bacterium]|nr:TetR/AcrR family transcriptional regulator [Acidimicrobiales bacterium]
MAARIGLTKNDVLEAAAAIVDEQGADALTLSGLAGRLGVRSQSLYAHVDGLTGLKRDLILYALHQQAVRVRRSVMARSGREALMALMNELVLINREHPGLARLTSWSQPDPTDEAMFDALVEVSEPVTMLLASYGLSGDDMAHWRRIIWTSMQGFLSLEAADMMTLPADPDQSVHLLMDLIADGLERVRASDGVVGTPTPS